MINTTQTNQTIQMIDPGVMAADAIIRERNRFFTGKYLGPREFQLEQDYFLSRHRLHNRLVHGRGVVCGLNVDHHPNPDCEDRYVVVTPGIALDCYGRELVVQKKLYIPLPDDLSDEQGYLLCLRYEEEPIEMVPALFAEGQCDANHSEPNRVREIVCHSWPHLADMPDCWADPNGKTDVNCRCDCEGEETGPTSNCICADCGCGPALPIALIKPDPHCTGRPKFSIDMKGRAEIRTPQSLTHIAKINWPHGGVVSIEDFINKLGRRIEVSFDRQLAPPPASESGKLGLCDKGINPFTFSVQAAIGLGEQRQLISLTTFDNPPKLGKLEECKAYFEILEDNLTGFERLAGQAIYITLRCDFILDCRNDPVDGNFKGAILPSGDGTPGGTFESWFFLVDRYDPMDLDAGLIKYSGDLINKVASNTTGDAGTYSQQQPLKRRRAWQI